MIVRRDRIVTDIQDVIVALLESLQTTAPWNSWKVVRGFPNIEILGQFAKPVIYVMPPEGRGKVWQCGGAPTGTWQMTIGAWDDGKTGGPEEISIVMSELWKLFAGGECHRIEFDVEIGGIGYQDVTLGDVGIKVVDVDGPTEMMTVEDNEFRVELRVLIVGG